MSAEARPTSRRRVLVAGASAFGLLIYATLPSGVVAANDDFGYLKSVVQTLQHGRPWTNDWLEPWAASLSVMCSVLYRLSDNFQVATQGLQAALAATALLGAAALFLDRGFRPVSAVGSALVLLTFPVILWKTLEFTAMALYLPCLLWALWAAARARWGIFCVFWMVAVASRQSAVIWLALPAFAVGRALVFRATVPAGNWRRPALVLAAAVPWLVLLLGAMNHTHAQSVRTAMVLAKFSPANALVTVGAGLAVFLLSAGLGAFALLLRDCSFPPVARPLWLLALAALGALAAFVVDARRLLVWDMLPLGGAAGWCYLNLLVAAAIVGWLSRPVRFAPAPVLLALASLLLLAVRGDRYDYYFADLALAAFFAVRPERPAADFPLPLQTVSWPRPLASLLVVILLALQARFDYQLKLTLDRAWAACSLYESALRSGKIHPAELHAAPFGYVGWHVHPASVAYGSDSLRRFAGFDRHPPSVAWEIDESERAITPDGTLVARVHRIGWFRERRFFLRRLAPMPASTSPAAGRFIPFPLEAAEWKRLIEGPRL